MFDERCGRNLRRRRTQQNLLLKYHGVTLWSMVTTWSYALSWALLDPVDHETVKASIENRYVSFSHCVLRHAFRATQRGIYLLMFCSMLRGVRLWMWRSRGKQLYSDRFRCVVVFHRRWSLFSILMACCLRVAVWSDGVASLCLPFVWPFS